MMLQPPGLSRRQLDTLIDRGPAHFIPIWLAVRDHGAAFALVKQGRSPFDLPSTDRPTIILVGDDVDAAHGPDGFDRQSLRSLVQAAHLTVVVSCTALPVFYSAGAFVAAVGHRSAVIVETRPAQELPWIAFIRSVCPEIPILVGTVKGGRA